MPADNSSQNLIDISEIRDGVVVLKNGTIRAIIMASSINFFLKSPEEQDAIIFGYQSFLNSLDFPIQIVVNSRKLKIDEYLETLKKIEKEQTNDLLKMQTSEYGNFIKELVEMSNIMSKSFYVIIPFSTIESKQSGISDRFLSILKPKGNSNAAKENFEQIRSQLLQRVELVSEGLNRLGVQNGLLGSQEAVELFYNMYNPDLSGRSSISNIESLNINAESVR